MTKTEELLAVLDLPEDEQLGFLNNLRQNRQLTISFYGFHCQPDGKFRMSDWNRGLLADLAFRPRDEAVMLKSFQWTAAEVYNKAHHFGLKESETHAPTMMVWVWFATHAQPIHWIIASLIAKAQKP